MSAPAASCLSHDTVLSSLLHDTAQAPLLEVAAMLWETISKLVRQEPETLGLSARDRLTSRTSHPVRALADRVARGFGDVRFDLYLNASTAGTGRLLPGDPSALVLPPGFEDQPELEQIATLARLLTYVALDIPWVEELPASDVDGILFGALRVGLNLWGQGELSPSAEMNVGQWRQRMVKAVKAASRKVRRALEESAQRLHAPADSSLWRDAMRITGLRAAFVDTGDLTTALNQAMKLAPDLAGVHGHTLATKLFAQPLTRELVVFALSDTAMTLRRAAGTS